MRKRGIHTSRDWFVLGQIILTLSACDGPTTPTADSEARTAFLKNHDESIRAAAMASKPESKPGESPSSNPKDQKPETHLKRANERGTEVTFDPNPKFSTLTQGNDPLTVRLITGGEAHLTIGEKEKITVTPTGGAHVTSSNFRSSSAAAADPISKSIEIAEKLPLVVYQPCGNDADQKYCLRTTIDPPKDFPTKDELKGGWSGYFLPAKKAASEKWDIQAAEGSVRITNENDWLLDIRTNDRSGVFNLNEAEGNIVPSIGNPKVGAAVYLIKGETKKILLTRMKFGADEFWFAGTPKAIPSRFASTR